VNNLDKTIESLNSKLIQKECTITQLEDKLSKASISYTDSQADLVKCRRDLLAEQVAHNKSLSSLSDLKTVYGLLQNDYEKKISSPKKCKTCTENTFQRENIESQYKSQLNDFHSTITQIENSYKRKLKNIITLLDEKDVSLNVMSKTVKSITLQRSEVFQTNSRTVDRLAQTNETLIRELKHKRQQLAELNELFKHVREENDKRKLLIVKYKKLLTEHDISTKREERTKKLVEQIDKHMNKLTVG
ncbi:Cdk5rap2, partial [Acrasis kona]